MRFASALTFLSLGAVASASALPNVLGAYDLAMPVEEREVPTLECDDKPLWTGTLKLVSAKGRETNAAFEGVRNAAGLQQLDVGKGGGPAREEKFSFTVCKSSFMGYETEFTKAADVYYGRLQPAHLVGKRCVSASRLAASEARLVADKCSDSDDSGQLLQFWSLTQQPSVTGVDYYVNFLGKPSGESEDFPGEYALSKTSQDNVKFVKLAYEETPNGPSPYFFKLV